MTEYKRPDWIERAPTQYQSILEKHDMWLKDIKGGSRADLSRADLSRANLYGANLYGADLYGANLYGANLSRASLYGADLSGANLSGANLSRANLSGASLSGANLSRANLYGANLSRASLYGADLSGANLYGKKLKIQPLQLIGLCWWICTNGETVQIGCQTHKWAEWLKFEEDDISKMADGAWEWWKEHKPLIAALVEQHNKLEEAL